MENIIQSALFSGEPSLSLLGVIFTAGLLTSLTPCVYPMLPITVSVVGSQAKNRWQGLLYSLTYVSGLAMVYSFLGLIAASTGQLFGTVASHPATLLLVGTSCLLMGLWMAGVVATPNMSFGQSYSSNPSFLTQYPSLKVFSAGALSGLVMAPCTSPVLGMMLMYVASNGSPSWASLMMFVFAFGMSAILVVAGTFTGLLTSLPRSGNWLNAVKWLIATPMFGVSLYFFYQFALAVF